MDEPDDMSNKNLLPFLLMAVDLKVLHSEIGIRAVNSNSTVLMYLDSKVTLENIDEAVCKILAGLTLITAADQLIADALKYIKPLVDKLQKQIPVEQLEPTPVPDDKEFYQKKLAAMCREQLESTLASIKEVGSITEFARTSRNETNE